MNMTLESENSRLRAKNAELEATLEDVQGILGKEIPHEGPRLTALRVRAENAELLKKIERLEAENAAAVQCGIEDLETKRALRAEAERLRAEITNQNAAIEQIALPGLDILVADRDALRAENARLREALAGIANDGCGLYDMDENRGCRDRSDNPDYWCWSCIAHAALEVKP